MGATSDYGFRYPEMSDAPNGPQALQWLAEDVEDEFNRRGIVARNRRVSNSLSVTTTEYRILSTIAPVVAGRTYTVECFGEITPTGGPNRSQHTIRYTMNNTEPTISSPILGRSFGWHASTIAQPDGQIVKAEFLCTTSGILRVVVTSIRVDGSGSFVWSASPDYPMVLRVIDEGPTVSTSGTVYSP